MLTAWHTVDRTGVCTKMLAMREVLRTLRFLDESCVVLGGDRGSIWYRPGQDNSEVSITLRKFPRSLMIFGVIGTGFNSHFIVMEGTADANQYLRSIDRLAFIDALDQKHGGKALSIPVLTKT
jgi:hypothetical protein